ncbi:CCD80 protein, partial [Amia calva]|nr:CCD80 protein [Amia calva]
MDLDFLSGFAGKNRLWVITAPSRADHYLRMMEKQMEESEGLNCRLAERDTFTIIVIQNALMEGKIRRTTHQGEAAEELLDEDTVSKLLHYLSVSDGTFSMLILKKNLKVGERFPYPVRVEAVLEAIDDLPLRKVEKLTRRGSAGKCLVRKRLTQRKLGHIRRGARVSSPLRQGNSTTVSFMQRRQGDKKFVLRSKIQDILRGKSRFVIRKKPGSPQKTLPRRVPFTRTKTNMRFLVRSRLSNSTVTNQMSGVFGTDSDEVTENARTNPILPPKQQGRTGLYTTTAPPDERSNTQDAHGTAASEQEKTNLFDSIQRQGQNKTNTSLDKADENTPGRSGKGKKGESKKRGKGKSRGGKKKGRRGGKKSQRAADNRAVLGFLENFQGKRRLLIITTPSATNPLYVQQRDENLEHSCDLALRKISTVTVLGSEHNSTLQLEHHQRDDDLPFDYLVDKSSDQDLISRLRKEYGMVHNKDFSMVLTDYDLQQKQFFDVPIAVPLMTDFIDSFPTRRTEVEMEKKHAISCQPQEQGSVDTLLTRFISKRRLLVISSPTEDDYSFQQQVLALNGQACFLGIRHFAVLKLIGAATKASGSLELFPLNGKSQSEKEELSQGVVDGIREHFKISKEYFSMLMIGKDGTIKSWYPTPVWSMAIVYDLVDSMELRQQEEKLQNSLGISCPEHQGYDERDHDRYH